MAPHFLDDTATERVVIEEARVASPRPLNKLNARKRGNELLTAREKELLRLLIAARRNAEIGADGW
jgi:hypothetical protein